MRSYAMIGALVALSAAPLSAQFRTGDINPTRRAPTTQGGVPGGVLGQEQADARQKKNKSDRIPRGHLPPAGMCRIWIDGVPPGQQPAPTDCQTAVATRPMNARVIWGDRSAFPGKGNGKFTKKGLGKSKKKKFDRDDDDGIFGADDRERRSEELVAKRWKKG